MVNYVSTWAGQREVNPKLASEKTRRGHGISREDIILMSTNESKQEQWQPLKLGRFSCRQVLAVIIGWLVIYGLGSIFLPTWMKKKYCCRCLQGPRHPGSNSQIFIPQRENVIQKYENIFLRNGRGLPLPFLSLSLNLLTSSIRSVRLRHIDNSPAFPQLPINLGY